MFNSSYVSGMRVHRQNHTAHTLPLPSLTLPHIHATAPRALSKPAQRPEEKNRTPQNLSRSSKPPTTKPCCATPMLMLRWDVEEGTSAAAMLQMRRGSKRGRCCTKVADRCVGTRRWKVLCAALCYLRRKGVRDTAVSRGEAPSEVSFARHMYSKITPTAVSKCWKYGCDTARCSHLVNT